MASTTPDFDEYLPVFIWSHAAFPQYGVRCKAQDPGGGTGELLFKTLQSTADFIT